MPSQSSGSSERLLLAELRNLEESIRRLGKRKLALEDLILSSLFRPSGELVEEPGETGEIELPETLPLRPSPVDCAQYFGWVIRAEEASLDDSEKRYWRAADADGHLIAAKIETAFCHPMADVVAVIHPELEKGEAVGLILKLASVIQQTGIHQGSPKLHTGRELPASAFFQVGELTTGPSGPRVAPPRSGEGGEMAAASPPSKLVETLTEYLAAAESQVIALAERTQASLRQELQTFHDEVGRLASDVSEQQSVGHAVKEICDQLAHSMRTLHETDATHAERLEALQAETQRITGQLESLSAATRQQQGEVHTLRRVMDQIVERLNRHADVIRSLHELQKHLAAFLLGTRVISDQ